MIDTTRLTPETLFELERLVLQLPTDAERAAAQALVSEMFQYGELPSLKLVEPPMPFRQYIREAWHVIEPQPYVHSFHIEAVAEHLEGVTRGQIRNLLINIPPRHSKSLIVSVMWPSWVWTYRAHLRWLFASYSSDLSTEHSWKCRLLLQSEWYQERWGHVFQLVGDQNLKTRYDNSKLGYRMATSVSAAATGFGGDVLVCDDPNNIKTIESKTARKEVSDWWDGVMSTRLNNPITGGRVVIQQRCHQQDLTGHILDQESKEWVRLILPTEFEVKRRCVNFLVSNKVVSPPYTEDKREPDMTAYTLPPEAQPFFADPRTTENELLAEERFPQEEIVKTKVKLGSYRYAGQHQQRPAPAGGGLFKRSWFPIVDTAPRQVKTRVRFWDAAGTENDGDYTVGLKLSELDGIFYVEHVIRGQWSSGVVNTTMKQTADVDGKLCRQREEQEPGSSGLSVISAHLLLLVGYDYAGITSSGDKTTRARPLAAQAEGGNVRLVRGEWNEEFLDEYENFPNGANDDQVDAGSGAFNEVVFGSAGKQNIF